MQGFDVLDRGLKVLTHRFLEASAGTGKTFAIEHLVVRFLVEEHLNLEQILVVTFTKAATRELKMRIRTSIERAVHELKTRAPTVDYLRQIVDKGEEGCREALRALNDALACFDQAQIFTIHSFCYRMLQEFAFEAGITFDLSDPQDETYSRSKREEVYNFFRTQFKPPLYGLSQIDAVLQKQQSDIGAVADKLIRILEKKRELPILPSFQEACQQFDAELKKFPPLKKEKVFSDFLKLAPHFKRVDLVSAQDQLDLLFSLLEKRDCNEKEFDALLREKHWFLDSLHPENQKKRATIPASEELNYPGLFDKLRESLLPHLHEAKNPLKTLMRMARDCGSIPSNEVSFDELLYKMEESLANPAFREKIRKRFRALIVDEFQDTDPLQWKIFETLFLNNQSSLSALYLVGDPKQSIYRFRGADVYTYLKAGAQIGERASLSTNFRSREALVHALNTLFSHTAHGNWLPLPSHESSLPFVPVNARERKKDEKDLTDGKGSIHFFVAQDTKGRERRFPTQKMEEGLFFPFIAQEIQNIAGNFIRIGSQGYSFRSFAILVKDRFQAERLQRFLKQVGIPSIASRGRNLIESKGFAVWEQLLKALVDPSEGKIVLAGPLFSFSQDELKKVHPKVFFEDFRKKFEERGFPLFFSDLMGFIWEGESVLERLVQVEDLYQEIRCVAQILMEERPNASCEELSFFLQEMRRNREERTFYPYEEDAVSIMTTHMSKGLEFDFVFALALASRHQLREELIFVREDGEERLESLDPDAPSSYLYLKEQDAEKMRQLYVALTRAKIRVYVPLAYETNATDLEEGERAPLELFFSEEKTIESALGTLEALKQKTSVTYSILEKQDQPLRPIKKETIHLVPPPQIHPSNNKRFLRSFSSLAQKYEAEETPAFPKLEEKNPHTLPLGAATGTILHQIFEQLFKRKASSSNNAVLRRQLIERELEGTPLKEWGDVVEEIISATLELPLPCEGASIALQEIPSQDTIQEMEFLFSSHGHLIKGFADLLFKWEGKYYLIDWKSNWLGPNDASYSPERLENAMRDNDYFLQGAIYAAAFERYVKLFDKRPFEELFGGAIYIFLRGKKAFHFFPDRAMLSRVMESI